MYNPIVCLQESNWYMEIALPTCDTQNIFCLALNTELVLVYNLVGIGLVCRDTACGMSIFHRLMIFSPPFDRSSLF